MVYLQNFLCEESLPFRCGVALVVSRSMPAPFFRTIVGTRQAVMTRDVVVPFPRSVLSASCSFREAVLHILLLGYVRNLKSKV